MAKKLGMGKGIPVARDPDSISAIQSAATHMPSIQMEISSLIETPGLTWREKRHRALEMTGELKPRKKYASRDERKLAAKERAKQRRLDRSARLSAIHPDLAPKPRVKRSIEEKRARRSERGKLKRTALKELKTKYPDIANELGLNFRRLI
jgi:hypothetical protein